MKRTTRKATPKPCAKKTDWNAAMPWWAVVILSLLVLYLASLHCGVCACAMPVAHLR